MDVAVAHALSIASAADVPLVPAGPRQGADAGDPQTSFVELHATPDDSLSDRADTEVCLILAGRGRITDVDGTVHPLAPGAIVTLPRGWSGRWDIEETVRKAFVVVREA